MPDEQLLYEFIKREFDGINKRLDEHFAEDRVAWKKLNDHDSDIRFVKRVWASILFFVTAILGYFGLSK